MIIIIIYNNYLNNYYYHHKILYYNNNLDGKYLHSFLCLFERDNIIFTKSMSNLLHI